MASPYSSEPERAGPAPGRAVRGSHTGRPIMALLDLLGRRWALRVIWELRDGRRLSFRELQRRCGQMSSSVLNQRLRELGEAGILASGRGGYALTDEGAALLEAFAGLDEWAGRWAERVSSRASE
jgi:DNA-binding HxlR family transcriptional regulator